MLSNTCKYGIRAIVFIASRQERKKKIGLKEISDELQIPMPYLAKVLQTLSKRKILDSSKGPHGGFSLLKDTARLTLMDLIRAIDGDDFTDNCFITGGKCSYNEDENKECLLHSDLKKERAKLVRFFSSKTIDSLVKQKRRSPSLGI